MKMNIIMKMNIMMKMRITNVIEKKYVVIIFFISSFYLNAQITDINGNVYETSAVGGNIWLGENLKVDKFNDGTKIYQATNIAEWIKAGNDKTPAWCYYNFDSNFSYMGKIYNWFVVSSKLEVSPIGWHIPSNLEWENIESNKSYSIFNNICGYLSYGEFKMTPNSYSPSYFGPWHSNDSSTPYNVILEQNTTGYLQHCATGCLKESGYTIRCVKNN
jgi:hypothetical protein